MCYVPRHLSDEEILRNAVVEGRIVITADKDFGELIFRLGLKAEGIILLRIDVARETERFAVFQRFWPQIEAAVRPHRVDLAVADGGERQHRRDRQGRRGEEYGLRGDEIADRAHRRGGEPVADGCKAGVAAKPRADGGMPHQPEGDGGDGGRQHRA